MKKNNLIKKLFSMVKAKTPIVGKKLVKAGVAFLGLAGAPQVLPDAMLPDIPDNWLTALEMISGIIGMFLIGAGSASTEDDPDRIG